MSSITEKVIEYLRLYSNAKPSDIANYLGINVNIVRSILSRLKRKGIVVKTGKGYSLRHGISSSSELKDIDQKEVLGNSTTEQNLITLTKTVSSTKSPTESISSNIPIHRVTDSDIDNLKSSVLEMHNKVLELERKILGIENTLNTNQLYSYTYKESLNLVVEVLEIIKMCLQAIAVNDINSLNSLVGDLEELIDVLKHKLKY